MPLYTKTKAIKVLATLGEVEGGRLKTDKPDMAVIEATDKKIVTKDKKGNTTGVYASAHDLLAKFYE